MYNAKTVDYFSNPRNMGKIKDADIVAQGGNPACGDVVKLYLKLSENRGRKTEDRIIRDIKFKAFGCGACLASTSALTELVKGKKISQAKKITNQDIADFLGGLPSQKMICSNFSADVFKKAIKDH